MDLEEELWRLRSVEYDLAQARQDLATAEEERFLLEAAQAITKEAMESVLQELKEKDSLHRSAAKARDETYEQNTKLRVENERLKMEVERYARASRMADRYNFRVVEGSQRQGWRLSR